MVDLTIWLADTSAWHRAAHPLVQDRWARALEQDRIAVTQPLRLELLYSARSAQEYARRVDDLDALRQVTCGARALDRALDVQRQLGERAALHHRSVKLVDLMIAGAAELAGVTVWHYDEDYDRIAAVTGQLTEWIAPRGSL